MPDAPGIVRSSIPLDHVPGTTVRLLSRPTKMPCPSWSLPAGPACPYMVTGEHSICGGCYALKGRYADPQTQHAQQVRFDWVRECLKTPAGTQTFIDTMDWAIRRTHYRYMRVHDSGDLFSPAYTRAWIEICRGLQQTVDFWFPTRSWRAPWVDVIRELAALPNVSVRPSALFFGDAPPRIAGLHAGTTVKSEGFTCPAPRQGGQCLDCRTCWLRKGVEVSYHARYGVTS